MSANAGGEVISLIGFLLAAALLGGVLLTWLRHAYRGAKWLLDMLAAAAYLLFFSEAGPCRVEDFAGRYRIHDPGARGAA